MSNNLEGGPSQEEIQKMAETRALSDAELIKDGTVPELLKDGAVFVTDDNSSLRLEVSRKQNIEKHNEMLYEQDETYRSAVETVKICNNITKNLYAMNEDRYGHGRKVEESWVKHNLERLEELKSELNELKSKYGVEIGKEPLLTLSINLEDKDVDRIQNAKYSAINYFNGVEDATRSIMKLMEVSANK